MSSARKIHREVCSLLLASLESLQQAHQQFLDLLHPHPAGTGSNPVERLKAKIQVTDCNKRLQHLSDMVKVSLLMSILCAKVSFTHRYTTQYLHFQNFIILISIDISIKTHQFVCISQA